ncbi:MAG: PDZ domain-containing protein [Chitinophagaceae bacterium]
MMKHILIITLLWLQVQAIVAQSAQPSFAFTVAMENPSQHQYQVTFNCNNVQKDWLDIKMPVWMPGYYQVMDYADNVSDFTVKDDKGVAIQWEKADKNTWRVYSKQAAALQVSYKVKTTRSFVATNYLDEERGFIAPPGVFVHVAGYLQYPVSVRIVPYGKWNRIATGLEPVAGTANTFTAPDFDVLYDSPLLVGNLDELPSFTVKGLPHYFIGYQLGQFDRALFMEQLKKVVEAATDMMGDIPYKHYTFISIGPGAGGIEHLNSAAVSFSGNNLTTVASMKGVLSFLGHEYFHHYNAKRIRPIELGPFDYDKGSRTNMLWVAEGVTAYYDDLLLRRAGIVSGDDLINTFATSIKAFENKPGHLFQSVSQASYDTWADGPFGRTGDDVNKTISYYEKGPALALILDFKIRNETKNKYSLDDVMRALYKEYYQQKHRGYTEAEFRAVCEKIAGTSLNEFFEYIYTVKEVDYPKYFAYAGLDVDTKSTALPGAWHGVAVRERNDSLMITNVDWNSPAWFAGIRPRQVLLSVNGEKASVQSVQAITKDKKPGDIVHFQVAQASGVKDLSLILETKYEKPFTVTRVQHPTALQAAILKDWLRGRE